MKCIVCGQRKGKRQCPAKDGEICAKCCGEKRILEINCPEDCQYLKMGRSYEAYMEHVRHLRSPDPVKQRARARLLQRFEQEIAHLEYVVAQERRSSRDLRDRDVAQALDDLLATYRTEQKGIVYERTSNDLRVEALRRSLKEVVDEKRKGSSKKPDRVIEAVDDRLRLDDAIDCLQLVREVVESHLTQAESGTGYVDFLARSMPRGGEVNRGGPSIIVPGA